MTSAQTAGSSPSSANPGATENPARFDLNFPGGSPDALIELLRRASDGPVNALIPLAAKDLQLPPLNYRNVTVDEVLAPLQSRQSVNTVRGESVITQQESYGWQLQQGIWVMFVQRPTETPVVFRVEPVNVRRLLEHFTIDDLTTAIDSAWKLQGTPAENRLLFHSETALLLIKGRDEDIAAARKVLASLQIEDPPRPLPAVLKVNILGSVNQPGSYTLPADGTLIDAIAKAGGTAKLANRRKVTIRREGENAPEAVIINLDEILDGESPATPLQSGDTIFVPERLL